MGTFFLVMCLSINIYLTLSANTTRNFGNTHISSVYWCMAYLL